jgi:hypothetical protein
MPPQPREPGSLHRAATRSRAVNPNRDRKGVGAGRLAFAESHRLPYGRGSVFADTNLVFCLQHFHVRMLSVLTDFDRTCVERFKQATEEKLRDVRCPEHRQAPRLRFQGTSLRDISISISGCCQKVMDLANSAVGSVGQASGLPSGQAGGLSYARPNIRWTPSPNVSDGVSRLNTRKASFSKS